MIHKMRTWTPPRLNAGENHVQAASATIKDDAAELEVAAEERRKRFMMPFSKKQKDEPADEERIERPKSPFDDEHNIALDGQPDHRDAIDPDDADYEEEEEEKESFLSRHRQPILLGASIIAIVAMTANLINQNTGQTNGQGAGDAPALTQPTDATCPPWTKQSIRVKST